MMQNNEKRTTAGVVWPFDDTDGDGDVPSGSGPEAAGFEVIGIAADALAMNQIFDYRLQFQSVTGQDVKIFFEMEVLERRIFSRTCAKICLFCFLHALQGTRTRLPGVYICLKNKRLTSWKCTWLCEHMRVWVRDCCHSVCA